MNYSEFLLANLLREQNSEWNEMPYDEMFGKVSMTLKKFEKSSYNVDDRSEYDCMVDWIKEVYNSSSHK